jgi:hypothetical protein
MNVQHDDVDGARREGLPSLVESLRFVHRPTVELQVHTAQETDSCVVVDDEHGVAGRVHAGRDSTRTYILRDSVYSLKMRNEGADSQHDYEREIDRASSRIPRPSPQFRRRSWLAFQRALDPLARPRQLRGRQQR